MTGIYIVSGVSAIGLLAYLIYALIKAEDL
jgi:K+-transporting ATPase KdpF subunit